MNLEEFETVLDELPKYVSPSTIEELTAQLIVISVFHANQENTHVSTEIEYTSIIEDLEFRISELEVQ